MEALSQLRFWDTKELRERDELGKRESYDLSPGEFILGITYESVRIPPNLIARVEGRSSYARLGLSMHQTAPWIQPGFNAPIVLEIANIGSLTVKLTPVLDLPCQLTFFELKTPLLAEEAYGSRPDDKYQGQTHPLEKRS
jgi:dCTP deaminase